MSGKLDRESSRRLASTPPTCSRSTSRRCVGSCPTCSRKGRPSSPRRRRSARAASSTRSPSRSRSVASCSSGAWRRGRCCIWPSRMASAAGRNGCGRRWPVGRCRAGRLEIRWGSRSIGAGLEEDIMAWLDAHPDAALVAIDTLGKVRPRSNGKRNAYEVDVEDLGRLQALFRDRSRCPADRSPLAQGIDATTSWPRCPARTGSPARPTRSPSSGASGWRRSGRSSSPAATSPTPSYRRPVRRDVASGAGRLARSLVRARRGLRRHRGVRADLPEGDRRPARQEPRVRRLSRRPAGPRRRRCPCRQRLRRRSSRRG